MMSKRGLTIDHTTVCRWVQYYAPEMKTLLDGYRQGCSRRWHIDETYIKVKVNGTICIAVRLIRSYSFLWTEDLVRYADY